MSDLYKRKKEPQLNKQLVLDAAADIGANQDWHAVTFQAIADKTGLSKGGIMHHFRSKDDLLEELMRQSLAELTLWMNQHMAATSSNDPSLAYLKFIIDKSPDEKYQKTMKVIHQAIVTGKLHWMWEEWFQENIAIKTGPDPDISTLIIQLVADGLWYADTSGFPNYSNDQKHKIFTKLCQLP